MLAAQHAGEGPGKAGAFKRAIFRRNYVPIAKAFGYRFPAPQLGVSVLIRNKNMRTITSKLPEWAKKPLRRLRDVAKKVTPILFQFLKDVNTFERYQLMISWNSLEERG